MFFNTPKTVAYVVASFQQTIGDLKLIADQNTQKACNLADEITMLEAEKENAMQESVAAQKIADKISKLISA
jgi:hypothetical protein